MIHLRKEGQHFKIGLNITLLRGSLAVNWVWFDFARQEGSYRGFALSRRGFRRRSARWNLIDSYLRLHGLSLVQEETLQDLRAAEALGMRLSERSVYIKPRSAH